MKQFWVLLVLLPLFCIPVSARDFTAPEVPEAGSHIMPESDSFADGLWQMLQKALDTIVPDFRKSLSISASAMAVVILVSTIQTVCAGTMDVSELGGTIALSVLLLLNTNSMIQLGSETILQITDYGKLLLPVMTAALAAEGGLTSSAALYTGTAVFNTVLSAVISGVLLPLVYFFLALSVAAAGAGTGALKNLRDFVKVVMSWCLKTILTVFTTYMSITGVVTGATDVAALKATKIAISSMVPVVGGIMSDASEAVLVSAGLAKNAAGIYGIFAVLAVFLVPFLRIGVHYLVLKLTCALSGVFGVKRLCDLIGDFSAAMGLMLAMTGSSCLMQLISTVCFLKGVG